jgi:acyl carrier protein
MECIGLPTTASPSSHLRDDLRLESLEMVHLAVALEDLGVAAPDDVFLRLHTLGDVYELYLLRHAQGELGSPPDGCGAEVPGDGTRSAGLFTTVRSVQGEDWGWIRDQMWATMPFLVDRYNNVIPTAEQFASDFSAAALAIGVVCRSGATERVGVVAATGYSSHGHAYLLASESTSWLGTGLVIDGLAVFIDGLFRQWPLHHLFAEVLEEDLHKFRDRTHSYFEVVARLRDHHFVDGRWTDQYILRVARSVWQSPGNRYSTLVAESRG